MYLSLSHLFYLACLVQLCLALCDPIDCSLPGSSVHGILHARILEWVAIPFSRGIFLTQGLNWGLLHCRQILYHLSHQGSPLKPSLLLQMAKFHIFMTEECIYVCVCIFIYHTFFIHLSVDLMWCRILIDLQILNHPCTSGINLNWL